MLRTISILVFPDAETLDYAGPFEVFSVANRKDGAACFEVHLVARERGPIRGAHGFTVHASRSFADVQATDVLLVPGGWGTRALIHDEATITWIRETAKTAELVLSVCTGSFLLAQAGLLDGLPCTTHWASIERMRRDFPALDVRESVRFVDNGRIATSAGISAGLDLSLHIVGRLLGAEHAAATARQMEYAWPP